MLYGLLLTLYIINCFLLILVVLIQKGKGSMGLGNFGGGAQMLFGGSGGQDVFQKITWGLGTIFMAGALVLSIMKSRESIKFRYLSSPKLAIQQKTTTTEPATESATESE